jgi:hypothetical protein
MFPDPIVKGLDTLFLYPYFQTREAYEKATGRPCPPWRPDRPPKGWFDPKALESTRRNIVYDNTLVYAENGHILSDANGKPMLDVLVLVKEHAAEVNIPDKTLGAANIPGSDRPEVPVPLRALEPDEELFFIWGQTVAVRSKKGWAQTQNTFTWQDRLLLEAIADKLGVPRGA